MLISNRMQISSEQYDNILDLIPSGIFTVDKDRLVTSWNKKAEEITGYSKEEVIGKVCLTFALHPCTSNCGLYADDVSKPIFSRECTIRRKDGQIRYIIKNADLLRDEAGNAVGGVETFNDVTERKIAEIKLKESEAKFRGAFESSAIGFGLVSKEGIWLEVNKKLCEIVGYPEEELLVFYDCPVIR